MSQEASVPSKVRESLRQAALDYHEFPIPGKLSVTATKPLPTSAIWRWPIRPAWPRRARDRADPNRSASLTSRANLVGRVSNGTAVLGLGNIGPLARSR
jgi:malate dehydrogenase (oxaloacetate-decarboxylating)(NADP+)